jgi:hypothetical protein
VLVVAAVAVAAAVVGFFLAGPLRRQQPPAAAQPVAAAPTEPANAPGRTRAPSNLPPLDETDPIVRDLIRKLSAHPRVVAWLATKGLIRNFTYVVANIADGKTPAGLLQPLRPSAPFRVAGRGKAMHMDPQSGKRYTPLAQAVASIDPAAAAQVYSTLGPRIEDAFDEIAEPGATFDDTLERAIVLLLKTPIPPEPFDLDPQGIGYAFADPKLENLAPAQKQLLRMGAENARVVQTRLREVALAIGIPATRLP